MNEGNKRKPFHEETRPKKQIMTQKKKIKMFKDREKWVNQGIFICFEQNQGEFRSNTQKDQGGGRKKKR